MMAQAGVTVAISNRDQEILLPRAIASALRATRRLREAGTPAEVLVVDDSSRDGSQTLLRRLEALHYKDGLRCLAFGTAAGRAATRNDAAHHARHRYLTLLDADQELIPENLPMFVDVVRRTRAAAAYGNLLVRTPSAEHAHHVLSNESMQKKLFQHANYVDAFSVWDRHQLLDAGGFDASLEGLEDHEMWLHLAANGRRIVFVPAVIGYCYILPDAGPIDAQAREAAAARIARRFNQTRARDLLQMSTCHLRYHPALGYI